MEESHSTRDIGRGCGVALAVAQPTVEPIRPVSQGMAPVLPYKRSEEIGNDMDVADITSNELQESPKSRLIATLLLLVGFTGVCGLHRLYVGRYISGVLMLLTMGAASLQLVDLVRVFNGHLMDKEGRQVSKWV